MPVKNLLSALFVRFLPKNGGELSGAIRSSCGGNATISSSADNSQIRFYGGSDANRGANVDLYGESSSTNPGGFSIRARNSSGIKMLQGTIEGRLTWDNRDVETCISKQLRDHGFYKLNGGLVVQWGFTDVITHGKLKTVVFPTPFSSTEYSIVVTPISNATTTTSVTTFAAGGKKTTSVDVSNWGVIDSACQYIAIGH